LYHPEIIDRRLRQAKRSGIIFQRLPREKSIEISRELESLRFRGGEELPEGALSRDLTSAESAFIRSEQTICKADFSYYLTRYHSVELDPGVGTQSGIGPAILLESQRKLIHEIGKRELTCHEEKKAHGHTAGIRVYAHKCRQVAFTSTLGGAKIHRMLFWPGTRCFAATLKDGPLGTGELYRRDMLAIESLPFWMKPPKDSIYPQVKDEEIGFSKPWDSHSVYQAENSRGAAGVGTGSQQDFSHLTEVPLWTMPGQIRFSFLPSVPKAISSFHAQEGTSAGKGGYWHEVSEGCRKRKAGFEDWIYVFIPVYLNRTKYRANPPGDWKPEDHTLKYADLVERTSPEFCDGVTFQPSIEHLYWWERERALHAQNGELASFLANYPATPEQSFVNNAQGALPVELIEKMEYDIRTPELYEVEVDRDPDEDAQVESSGDKFPETFYVGRSKVSRFHDEPWEVAKDDPRGVLLLWEPPDPNANYILGCDSAEGITGWSRGLRVDGDHKKDNGVIEIFRVDGVEEKLWKTDELGARIPDLDPITRKQRVHLRDVQVAEFAAPCDAVEIAQVANILGRIYHGRDEDRCPIIWESYPGCGMLTTQELLRLGYGNLWHWEYFANVAAEETNQLGWRSSRESMKILWLRSRRHLMQENAVIRSRFLLDEYANAEIDLDKMRARAAYGFHDDRFMSANMAFWAGHKWTYNDTEVPAVREAPPVLEYQRMAPGPDEHLSYRDWVQQTIDSWED
jgi:hypothetical protein